MLKTSAYILSFVAISISASVSGAMPESLLGSRTNGAIPKMIKATNGNLQAVQSYFSKTQVPELDQLWDSRRDISTGSCVAPHNDCRVLSVFHGSVSTHPIVLMPGFTGYRKMYLEQIYDLLNAGYGPVYISDFVGSGDSYKPELEPGLLNPPANQMLGEYRSSVSLYRSEVAKAASAPDIELYAKVIGQLPLGRAFISDFDEYLNDVDFVMNTAVRENPKYKIMIAGLSMSGLVLARALALQDWRPTWISHVDRIVLESPMLRTLATNKVGQGLGGAPQAVAGIGQLFLSKRLVAPEKALPEFVDKALGFYNPKNSISHSINRLTLTDSIRVWNGHETAGSTIGWGYQELSHQYALGLLDSDHFFDDPLNNHMNEVKDVLKRNSIGLVAVRSLADEIVDPSATQAFLTELADSGVADLHLCTFTSSRHVIDQETDRYREPYMSLLIEQKRHVVRRSYGTAPQNEVLECHQVLSR